MNILRLKEWKKYSQKRRIKIVTELYPYGTLKSGVSIVNF